MSETTVIIKGKLLSTGNDFWRFPEIGGCHASFDSEAGKPRGWWYVHSQEGNFLGVYRPEEDRFFMSRIGNDGGWERKDVGFEVGGLENAVRLAYMKWEECGRNTYKRRGWKEENPPA